MTSRRAIFFLRMWRGACACALIWLVFPCFSDGGTAQVVVHAEAAGPLVPTSRLVASQPIFEEEAEGKGQKQQEERGPCLGISGVRLPFLPNPSVVAAPVGLPTQPPDLLDAEDGEAGGGGKAALPTPKPKLQPSPQPTLDAEAVAAFAAFKKRQLDAIESDRETLDALKAAIAEIGAGKELSHLSGQMQMAEPFGKKTPDAFLNGKEEKSEPGDRAGDLASKQ